MKTALRKHLLVPFFALGIGMQIPDDSSSFLQSPPSAEEISSDILQRRQEVSAVEAVRSLPGIIVLGSEVTTYTGSLFMRGSNGDQTLFVWNDFRSDNFTSPTGATDPFGFGAELSNRFRILKGPQSLLYGTQAMGGVVLIDHDPDLESSLEVAGGSLATSRGVGEFRFRGQGWQMAAGGSIFNTEGVSTYNAEIPRGRGERLETDGRQKSSVSLIASFDLSSQHQLQFMVNGLRDRLSDDVPPLDDINARTENRSTQWKARYKARWSDKADSFFLLTRQDSDRENKNPADIHSSDYYLDRSRGQRTSFLNRNNVRWLESLWQVGLEYNDEHGDFFSVSHLDRHDGSVYLVNDWNFKSADFSWGVRGNCQEFKDCVTVYQISYQRHWVESQRSLYGVVSSGLKRPTLYQLYSNYGDQNLQAETSQAYEVGVIQRFGAAQKIKLSFFDNRFKNLIDYDFGTLKYKNTRSAKTQGIEFLHHYETAFWDTQFSLAQVHSKDEDTGLYLLRRPVWQGAWDLGYSIAERFRVGNEFIYISKREDSTGGQRVTLSQVALWNMAVTYQWANTQYFVRVNNVGNTFHEDIKGYQTPGRFIWLGAKTFF